MTDQVLLDARLNKRRQDEESCAMPNSSYASFSNCLFDTMIGG